MTKLLRRLGLGWLAWRLLGPEPVPAFSADQVHPMRISGRSVFVGDREFFVRESGLESDPPLVLVHGWGDHTQILWHRLIPLLEKSFRVIAIDLRNHGRSATDRGRIQIANLADDVAGIMDAVGVGSPVVFGYSLGGMIVQELAHRHPAKVSAAVLGGTSAGNLSLGERLAASLLWFSGRAVDRVSRVEFTAVKHAYLLKQGGVAGRHSRWLWNELMDRDPVLYWEAGFAALRFDSTEWVKRLPMPSLVLIPTEDQLIRPSAQYDLAARLANPELLELSGARHEAPITHAAEIAEAIQHFTEKQLTTE